MNEEPLVYLADLDSAAVRVYRPLAWQLRGLQQTSSGYGSKLTSSYCVRLSDGRVRRIYVTQYSNSGTAWIKLDGVRRLVRGRSFV